MRPFITFILVFFILPLAEAQINLVPNPSFEDTVFCPIVLDNMDDVQDWSSFGNSADYFNGCSTTGMNVPNAVFGYQLSHSGNAFCGTITYHRGNSSVGNNYREYIGAQLLSPLQIGTKYYFSFYAVSATKNGAGFFSNNIGLRFFNNSYSKLNPALVDNFAHLKLDTLLTDTINWHKISGSFIADSNYQYVSIGNFYDASNTDTLIFLPFPLYAYYYIDDICVTTDSLYNETWTGLYDIEKSDINLWPNPVQDYFQYKSKHQIDEVIIYDSRGKLIKREFVNSMEGRINVGVISEGIYFASFKKNKIISVHKFLKF
ncbi:MAG: T9SS type A sorting domain-containing protein [Bacteroidetes bacterium]|nr:T9SS type A sorting domain-containing protein [Bacteroidota bacterium]